MAPLSLSLSLSLSLAPPPPPHQVCRILELLEQLMIQDTTKLLSKTHHLMLNERERDEATLPLDLWKTPVKFPVLRTG